MSRDLRRALPDSRCRFLCERSNGDGEFSKLLKALGLSLPSDVGLRELGKAGLVVPVLRIRLPDSFLRSWENFPSISMDGDFKTEDVWATWIWNYSAAATWESKRRQEGLADGWELHWTEQRQDPITNAALQHAISPAGDFSYSVDHPRLGRSIRPVLDYYAYWQAYQIAALLSLDVLPALPPLPGWFDKVEAITARVDRKWVDLRMSLALREFEELQAAFALISRYRTIRGLWLISTDPRRPPNAHERLRRAVAKMCSQQAADLAQIDDSIERLTEVSARWKRTPSGALLQQDLHRAMELRAVLFGRPHRETRREELWRVLSSLPEEELSAELLFPSNCSIYLSDLSRLASSYDHEVFVRLGKVWWPDSAPFRRLALNLERLHQHHSGVGSEDDLVSAVAETPEDFLILFGLGAERLFRSVVECAGSNKALVEAISVRLATTVGVSREWFRQHLDRIYKEATSLHELSSSSKKNPFEEAPGYCQEHGGRAPADLEALLCKSLLVFAAFRNYAAHHDCLDHRLVRQGWARPALEATLTLTVLLLSTSSPKHLQRSHSHEADLTE